MKEILHFSANWCNPCRIMEPFIEEFIKNNQDIKYTKIDVDNNIDITRDHNVMSVPTIIAFLDSLEIKRHVGVAKLSDLDNLFN